MKKFDPNAKSGPYIIDTDGGLQPFNVTCDMSDKNEIGVTVISHGSEDKTLVDGYKVGGSYSRDIHYNGANMPQLVSLINVSLFCEQLIKYECFSSNMEFAFWVSRDSVERTYWGRAAPDSSKCACGMYNTCASKDEVYNCNTYDKLAGGQWSPH